MSLWRKLVVLVSALAMAFVLTACGGPSESKASDFALEITKAMFAGNTKPMLDNMDYSGLDETQKVAARQMAEGKLKDIMSIHQAVVAQKGGVDNIKVTKVEVKDDIYNVIMLVTFNDGQTQDSNLKLRWSKDVDNFVILAK